MEYAFIFLELISIFVQIIAVSDMECSSSGCSIGALHPALPNSANSRMYKIHKFPRTIIVDRVNFKVEHFTDEKLTEMF